MNMEPIVRRHADMVYRLALVHTQCKQDAEDVFQDVFLQLIKHWNSIENDDHLRFWLIRVTINRCHSLHKSGWKKNVVTMERLPEKSPHISADHDDTVYEAVRALPEKYRSVLHLHYYEDLYIREIAQIRQCSEGTIKSQLCRGRDLLEKKLREARYVEE